MTRRYRFRPCWSALLPLLAAACAPDLTRPDGTAVRGAPGALSHYESCATCVVVFGPREYVRDTRAPVTDVQTFEGDPDHTYEIEIEQDAASDGEVTLNGVRLLAYRAEGELGPRRVLSSVSLDDSNTIVVRLTGQPGSALRATVVRLSPDFAPLFAPSRFALVPAGTFDMGSATGGAKEQPVHSVTISTPFYIGRTEVTQRQWMAVMGSNPSYFSACGLDCPVEQVSWEDAQAFIAALNAALPGAAFRLPTEAEWEYAARAGTTGDFGGTGDADQMGWHAGNSGGQTHPVGQKAANAFDLHDMHGNVYEWVQDWYRSDYYAVSPPGDPQGPESGEENTKAIRGGSWEHDVGFARSWARNRGDLGARVSHAGLRLVRN